VAARSRSAYPLGEAPGSSMKAKGPVAAKRLLGESFALLVSTI
jgi:hypothetical protein